VETAVNLTEACTDLALLITRLPAALLRDNTPGEIRAILSAGGVANTDVLQASVTIAREIPATRSRACQLAGEPAPPRPIATCLRALPRLASRLTDLGIIYAARQIETDVTRWTRIVKLALGLRTRDMPIGSDCPDPYRLHDGQRSPLMCLGYESFIRDDGTLYRQYAATIMCYHCGASWAELQWLHLGLMLETA
jgi:hypothetical protein